MLSPNTPTNIDEQPTDLAYWIRRAADQGKARSACEYYVIYKGCDIVLHPHRAALVKFDGRQVIVQDRHKYKNRGWLERLVEDVEKAIKKVKAGGGETPEPLLGDLLRLEIKRREETGQRDEADCTDWWEWLRDDELPLVFGAWLHHAGIVGAKHTLTRMAVVDFHMDNDEFNSASIAVHPDNVFIILRRLAKARGAPVKG